MPSSAQVPNPIALAVVGSQAYGLATPDSDVDRLGVYVEPTQRFHGLNPPIGKVATYVRHGEGGDVQFHEVGKFLGLVLGGNPTVSELLWLPQRCYEIETPWFAELRSIRHSLLCAPRVRDAYYGYAYSQFTRLVNKGRFAGSDEQRREKHARHLLRLIDQGLHAYEHGEIVVEVADPERYRAFGRACMESTAPAEDALTEAREKFDRITTPLPENPDRDKAEEWLLAVRADHLEAHRGA